MLRSGNKLGRNWLFFFFFTSFSLVHFWILKPNFSSGLSLVINWLRTCFLFQVLEECTLILLDQISPMQFLPWTWKWFCGVLPHANMINLALTFETNVVETAQYFKLFHLWSSSLWFSILILPEVGCVPRCHCSSIVFLLTVEE